MTEEAKQEETKAPEPLTELQRAHKILASQGKAPITICDASEEELAALVAMCDEGGNFVSDVPGRFREWQIAYYEARKANEESD